AYFAQMGSPIAIKFDPQLARVVCGLLAVLLVPVVYQLLFNSENGFFGAHGPPRGRVPAAIAAFVAFPVLAVAAWRGVQPRTAIAVVWLALGALWMVDRDSLPGAGGRLLGVVFLLEAWGVWTDRPRSTTGRAVL